MAIGDSHDLRSSQLRGDETLERVYDGDDFLRMGDGGTAVRTLQEALMEAGYTLPRFGADGDFGLETKTAVEAFQRDAGFTEWTVDGVVGSDTIEALDWRLAGETDTDRPIDDAHDTPSLADVFDLYRGRCECGEVLENNCAHFLTDAFIRAGYDELDGGTGARFRRHNGRIVCAGGRPVRAREMREWFGRMATDSLEGEPSDDRHWAVFQQDPGGYWGGHVALHGHAGRGYEVAGTGDYPEWRIQEHYTW
jgi:hypothetical protein